MRYRIFFINGETLLINEWQFSVIQTALTTTGDPVYMKQGDEPYIMVHIRNITHIIPEDFVENAPSGVSSTPSPTMLKDKKKQTEERLKGDTSAILKRTGQKYDED